MLLGLHPNELKICPHENLHTDVYGHIIPNCQKLEAAKMSFSTGKRSKLCIYVMENYSQIKRKLSSHGRTWRNLNAHCSQHKRYTVATADQELQRRIQEIPGVPIMCISSHKYNIEQILDDYGVPRF